MASKGEIQHRVDVMQAWLDGEIIQIATTGENDWDDELLPAFLGWGTDLEYRIKPKSQEVWLCEGAAGIFTEEEDVDAYLSTNADCKCTLFREVLE